jgi:hypothetical protein
MNCQHFREILPDIVCTPEEFVEQGLLAKKHAEKCAECAALLRHENILSLALRSIAEEDEKIGIAEEVREKLQSSFRERFGVVRKESSSKPSFSWLKAAVIAALVLGGLILIQMGSQGVRHQHATRQNSDGPATKFPLQSPRTSESTKDLSLGQLKKSLQVSVPIKAQRSQTARVSTAEIATEFIPLAPSDQSYGSLQRVRVMLPRNSLIQFGLPMNEERAEEPIIADLLIGDDGAPRAIRFVQDFQ